MEENRRTSPSITEIADINLAETMAMEEKTKTVKLHNPYEGRTAGRQLSETVEQFLRRLPPATTQVSHETPWIFIANPFAPRDDINPELDEAEVDHTPDDGTNWAQFTVLGRNLLEELRDDAACLAKKLAGEVCNHQARNPFPNGIHNLTKFLIQEVCTVSIVFSIEQQDSSPSEGLRCLTALQFFYTSPQFSCTY